MYKLKKALYGLKQAPRAWYSRIDSYLINNGFSRSSNEPTLYVKIEQGKILMVCLYVDDMIYTHNLMLEYFKTVMKKEFVMTNLGLMKYFLAWKLLKLIKVFLSSSISMLVIFCRDSKWINVNQQKPP